MKSGKMLVVYFTATNTTKKVAEQISKELNCDIYQIIPEKKYTSSDLNWNDENSRSTIEQKDRKARPKIKSPMVLLRLRYIRNNAMTKAGHTRSVILKAKPADIIQAVSVVPILAP